MAHFRAVPRRRPPVLTDVGGTLRANLRSIVPPSPTSQPPKPGRFPLMDAVRAIAALLILLYHASLWMNLSDAPQRFFDAMTIGVPVFFVISGFLLYRPFALAHLRDDAPPRVPAYAWRRLLRIVPPFWIVLTVVLFFGTERAGDANLLQVYGFAQIYDPRLIEVGVAQAWSLNCEVVYYAMIPLVALAVRTAASGADARSRLRLEVVGLIALVVLSEAFKLWFASFGDIANVRERIFLFHPAWNLDLFVAGMGIALWSVRRELSGRSDRLADAVAERSGICWLLAAVAFGGTIALSHVYYDIAGNIAYHAARLFCSVLLLLPVVFGAPGEGVVRRVLGQRWLLALGVLSYAIYLFHGTVLVQVFRLELAGVPHALRSVLLLTVSLAITITLAVGSWVLVERPVLSLKRLVPDRPRRAGDGALAPVEPTP